MNRTYEGLTHSNTIGFMIKKKAFRGITDQAACAMKELLDLQYVTEDLAARIKYDEHRFQERNKRKESLPPITNKCFNDVAFRLLGKSALCDAVDVYNSYCQGVLQLAVLNNPASVPSALAAAKHFGDRLKKAAKNKTDPAKALLDMFRTTYVTDGIVRKAIHTHLGIDQFPETELLCLSRNILVHKRGIDADSEIPAELKKIASARCWIGAQSFPQGHLPIAVDHEQRLIIDSRIGIWAVEMLRRQIHSIDQMFSAKYHLPTAPMPKLTIGRTFVSESM
jgi:hypothetical protein